MPLEVIKLYQRKYVGGGRLFILFSTENKLFNSHFVLNAGNSSMKYCEQKLSITDTSAASFSSLLSCKTSKLREPTLFGQCDNPAFGMTESRKSIYFSSYFGLEC